MFEMQPSSLRHINMQPAAMLRKERRDVPLDERKRLVLLSITHKSMIVWE